MKRTKKEIETLFSVMSCDLCVMSEHSDNLLSLERELLTCDNEIYNYYLDFYEVKEV